MILLEFGCVTSLFLIFIIFTIFPSDPSSPHHDMFSYLFLCSVATGHHLCTLYVPCRSFRDAWNPPVYRYMAIHLPYTNHIRISLATSSCKLKSEFILFSLTPSILTLTMDIYIKYFHHTTTTCIPQYPPPNLVLIVSPSLPRDAIAPPFGRPSPAQCPRSHIFLFRLHYHDVIWSCLRQLVKFT